MGKIEVAAHCGLGEHSVARNHQGIRASRHGVFSSIRGEGGGKVFGYLKRRPDSLSSRKSDVLGTTGYMRLERREIFDIRNWNMSVLGTA